MNRQIIQGSLFGIRESPGESEDIDLWYISRGFAPVAGIDEAGRGALAGPVCAAVVMLGDVEIKGLDDSKKIAPDIRSELYEKIWSTAREVGVALVGPGQIDEINILQATLCAMKLAVEMLRRPPGIILVDGNQVPSGLENAVAVVKGDTKSKSIMAASIIAKVTRDRYMDRISLMYPEFGFEKHKGYGVPLHYEALARVGPSEIHRMSFAPCREALTRLPEPDSTVTIRNCSTGRRAQ